MMSADIKDRHEAAWDAGELGLSEAHAQAAPADLDAAVDKALAMQLISIRLPQKLIDDLKLIAANEGLGYQPMIRRVLQRFASAEFRAMARESLLSEAMGAASGDDGISACG